MDQDSKDANGLLVELDKGLQSPNVGDQCEAIVRFTNLFQRYPMPILVNSAFFKLAEAFKAGTNFMRNQICEVFERNQHHLDKVLNIDDIYRNLFAVTTSNDPIARSLALLALGHIAPIVCDHKSAHHCISSSLETAEKFEFAATLICAASYVKVSAEFACNIYPKIVSIIDSEKYSIDIKIRALSVLDHKFYNANDAMLVRSFLIEVINKTKPKKLICASITLSTKISYTSLSHITAQIELLLDVFKNDVREMVRANALKNLLFLAEKSPHIWESAHVRPLLTYLENLLSTEPQKDYEIYCIGPILSIFCKLLTCRCNFIMQPEKSRIFKLSHKFALDNSDLALRTMAFELLTVKFEEHQNQVAKGSIEYKENDGTVETLDAIKTFLSQAAVENPISKKCESEKVCFAQQVYNDSLKLKSIFKQIVKLCSLDPHYCSQIHELVFEMLSTKEATLGDLKPYYVELMLELKIESWLWNTDMQQIERLDTDKDLMSIR